jgi:hypothetical protein
MPKVIGDADKTPAWVHCIACTLTMCTSDFLGSLGEESKAEEEEAPRVRRARAKAGVAKVA